MEVNVLTGDTKVAAQTQSSKGLDSVSGQDFMNILVKQLQLQDPFKPMSNEEMVSQISTIRELEMNSRMSQKLEQLTSQQRYGQAAALIGKLVRGRVTDEEGNAFEMEGVVTSIRFTASGDAMLELDSGELLPLAKVEEITNPQQ